MSETETKTPTASRARVEPQEPAAGRNALAVVDGAAVRTLAAIKADRDLIRGVIESVMRESVDYGTIPGCGPKPTLLKPGAEKLASTFRIAVEPVISDLSTADAIRYRVEARCSHMGSGVYLGSGVGECSTDEAKYRWRRAVCEAEWDATPEDRRRLKWARGKGAEAYSEHQIRTQPADLANTVLKIAKKRALVDAILTTTAASDIFTQDIEEMGAEHGVERGPEAAPPAAPPPVKPSAANGTKPPAKPNAQANMIRGLMRERAPEMLDDEAARQKWLSTVVGKTHVSDMTTEEKSRVIDALQKFTAPPPPNDGDCDEPGSRG